MVTRGANVEQLDGRAERTEPRNQLLLVDDDDEALGHPRHDLLARVRAAAPLVRLNAGSTSSAPSIAMSSWPISSGATTVSPSEVASSEVRSDVAVQVMSSARSPRVDDRPVNGRAGAQTDTHAVLDVSGRASAGLLP